MRIFKKKFQNIIESNQDILVFPTSLYKIPENTILEKITEEIPHTKFIFEDAIYKRKVDIGGCLCTRLNKDVSIAFLLSCLINNNDINDNINKRQIDYEMLYQSLIELLKDSNERMAEKIGFCIDDILYLGCDIDILESMIKSIFNGFDFTITFIYGK